MAVTIVDECEDGQYVDRTAAGADRAITWDFSFTGGFERCLKVQVGHTVRWEGNFGAHPLEADEGARPNPIVANAGDSGIITFDRPGTFGFRCNFHFEMRGAIQVVAAPAAVPWGTVGTSSALLALLLTVAAFARRRPVAYRRDARS